MIYQKYTSFFSLFFSLLSSLDSNFSWLTPLPPSLPLFFSLYPFVSLNLSLKIVFPFLSHPLFFFIFFLHRNTQPWHLLILFSISYHHFSFIFLLGKNIFPIYMFLIYCKNLLSSFSFPLQLFFFFMEHHSYNCYITYSQFFLKVLSIRFYWYY